MKQGRDFPETQTSSFIRYFPDTQGCPEVVAARQFMMEPLTPTAHFANSPVCLEETHFQGQEDPGEPRRKHEESTQTLLWSLKVPSHNNK